MSNQEKSEHEEGHGHEQQIEVTVQLIEGDQGKFKFNLHNTVQHMLDKALKYFEIEPPAGTIYYFLFDGRRLDNEKTLEQEGLQNGALVILGTEPQVG